MQILTTRDSLVSRSASVTSNLMARYRLAAYAEVLEAMGFEP